MRCHRSLTPLLSLVAFVLLTAAAPSPAPRPSLRVHETQLAATSEFRWTLSVEFRNPMSRGVYTDSLVCEAQDLGPGITHGPRSRFIPINFVKHQIPSLGTQDSLSFSFNASAVFEHARLILRYYSHDQDGGRYTAADTVEMLPAALCQQNPSVSFSSDGHDVEYYYLRGLGGGGSTPTVLLIHGDETHARSLLPLASELANKGYNVMAISLPGYGRSAGTPDLAGPASMRAAETALRALKSSRGVDSTRIVVWGIERGGSVSTRLAMSHPELAGAISTRGLYDLWAVARASKPLRDAFAREAGRDSSAWRLRSPASQPLQLASPLLIEYHTGDALVPTGQAQGYASALIAAGQPAEVQDVDGADRTIPSGSASEAAYAFIEKVQSRR